MKYSNFILILLSFFLSSIVFAQAEDNYLNTYYKLNADKTLRLEYIEHTSDYTIVYVAYTGNSNPGTFTGLYLNNFRLIDRDTYAEYKPVDTRYLPKTPNKFYVYNNGEELMFPILFNRLPSYVKNIDLVEGDGSTSQTYNFTFRDLELDPENNELEDLIWDVQIDYPYCTTFYTYESLTIDVYVDGKFIDKIDRKFKDPEYKPSCGEYGTMMIAFPNDDERKFYGTASDSKKKYTWNFTFEPKSDYWDICNKKNLTAGN